MRRLIRLLTLVALAGPASAEDAGRALFEEGAGAVALLADGQVEVPARRFACAGCHGRDGQGRAEGGTVFPPLAWSALTAASRDGGAYDPASLGRALSDGIAPDGRSLSPAMPRFRLEDNAIDALVAHLEQLDRIARRGITAGTLTLAAPEGDTAAGFAAALAEANLAGGAWGRRIVVGNDALAAADEVFAAAGAGIARAERRLVLGELARRGATALKIAPPDPDWIEAAAAAGLDTTPSGEAPTLLTAPPQDAAAPDLTTLAAGAVAGAGLSIQGTEQVRAGLLDAGLGRPSDLIGFIAGRAVAHAALECGRGMTRGCFLDALDGLDYGELIDLAPPG